MEGGGAYAHLYHRNDEGQGLPTARRGRNTKVPGPVATSGHQKPVGCALQEGRNHCCLDWTKEETQVTSEHKYPESAEAPKPKVASPLISDF